jgi:putative endopeptidase
MEIRHPLSVILLTTPLIIALGTASASDTTDTSGAYPTRTFKLSPTIDPCENFYQYVCSEEIKSFKLPSHRSRYTFYYADAYENFVRTMKDFSENLSKASNPSPRVRQILDFSASCKDEKSRIQEETKTVAETLEALRAIKTREELLIYSAQEIKRGRLNWLSLENASDTRDPRHWRIQVDSDWLTLPEKSYYQKPEVLKDFETLLGKFFKTVNWDQPIESATRVLRLETQLATIMPSASELDDRWDVSSYWSQSQFAQKFPLIANQVGLASIPKRWPVHQYTPEVYQFIQNALEKEDLSTLKDFLLFHLLKNEMDLAYPDYNAALRAFRHQHLGRPAERRSREEECAERLSDRLGRSLAFEMIQKIFGDFPKARFKEMVEKVRKSLIRSLQTNSWLSAKSRARAIKKIQTLDLALLYPSDERDWRFSPIVTLNSKSYLGNVWLLNQSNDMRLHQEVQQDRNLKAWATTPLYFDAVYYRSQNRFYFPAAFALKPIYDPDLAETKNLAGIGYLIGHELGHALDKFGSQYDEKGRKVSIFEEADQKKFAEFGIRLKTQFNAIGHNGELTLAENIADHAGLTAAYEAAFPNAKTGTLQDRKDFFTYFARSWCTAMAPSYASSHLKQDPHALPEARVNEQLKHMSSFSETYHCAPNSRMVLPASEQIRIW